MPDLTRLTDDQLENLEDFCTRKHRDELWDEVIAEILRRRPRHPNCGSQTCHHLPDQ